MHTVGIVGVGSIAAFYGKPGDAAPYCHAGGINQTDAVDLLGVADLDRERLDRFRTQWGGCFPDVAYYEGSTAMFADRDLDIIAVCTRGPHHYATTMEAIAAGPRAIFLEKPPSCSLQEMDEMFAAAKAKGIPITVSYSRHWAPHVLRLQELVRDGLVGDVHTVVAYTGGVFLSFASHVTDLICQFAGYAPKAITAVGTVDKQGRDDYEAEPSLRRAVIEFDNGVTGLHIGQASENGGFYADVFGTGGRLRAGIYTPPFVAGKDNKPVDLARLGMPENASPFKRAYEQIAAHLDGGPLPHCTDDDAIAVNELGFGGIESLHTGLRIELPNTNRTRKVYANG